MEGRQGGVGRSTESAEHLLLGHTDQPGLRVGAGQLPGCLQDALDPVDVLHPVWVQRSLRVLKGPWVSG